MRKFGVKDIIIIIGKEWVMWYCGLMYWFILLVCVSDNFEIIWIRN